MLKEEILSSLTLLKDEISIEEETEDHITFFDEVRLKGLTYYFTENLSLESLKERVYISPLLIDIVDVDAVLNYLITTVDKMCLLTLDRLYLTYNEDDYQHLYNYTGDEYALYILENESFVGITWVERNICIVDVNRVLKSAQEMAYLEASFDIVPKFNKELCVTVIHELRHLLLETNILLPEEEYPHSLGSEENVEVYGESFYEKHPGYILNSNFNIQDFHINSVKPFDE